MADAQDGTDSGTTTTKSPGGPIIQQSQESEEYQRALQTVVGTALGVILLVGLLALFFLLYRLRRQRHRGRFANRSQQHSPILQRSTSLDVGSKPVPSVLVLYAYDCAMHEAVVVALSGLLMEVCGVTTSLDVLEENVIMERGLEDWLEDRLQEADFILVVCSLGARLRCSKKRVRFREEAGRMLPDYFAVAVDYVAEKLRVERGKGLGVGKFLTVVMDYSRLSDIPPQLEAATAFTLMRDFHGLCAHLSAGSPPTTMQRKPLDLLEGGEVEGGEGLEPWQQTESGQELWAALGQARHYFKLNPNWLEDRLQPLPPPRGPASRAKKQMRRRRRGRGRRELDQMSSPLVMPLLPPPTAGELSSSVTNLNTSANVVIHMQPQQRLVTSGLVHSRQNSLPSSLSSSQPLPGTASVQQSVSRSVDSFPPSSSSCLPSGRDFGAEEEAGSAGCLLCQQHREGWRRGGRRVQCPHHQHHHQQQQHQRRGDRSSVAVTLSDTDGDSEDLELGSEAGLVEQRGGCARSKSLPSVGGGLGPASGSTPRLAPLPSSHTALEGFTNRNATTALSRSQTVLQAEVHRDGEPGGRDVPAEEGGERQGQEEEGGVWDGQLPRVPLAPKVWDLSKVPEGPKLWDSSFRPCGRGSPSSLSSDDSCASSTYSGNQSGGSDSLERDLRSITMPRIFDHSTCSAVFYPQQPLAPRSVSSSALVSPPTGSALCLPAPPKVQRVDLDFDFSPIQWDTGFGSPGPSLDPAVSIDVHNHDTMDWDS